MRKMCVPKLSGILYIFLWREENVTIHWTITYSFRFSLGLYVLGRDERVWSEGAVLLLEIKGEKCSPEGVEAFRSLIKIYSQREI